MVINAKTTPSYAHRTVSHPHSSPNPSPTSSVHTHHPSKTLAAPSPYLPLTYRNLEAHTTLTQDPLHPTQPPHPPAASYHQPRTHIHRTHSTPHAATPTPPSTPLPNTTPRPHPRPPHQKPLPPNPRPSPESPPTHRCMGGNCWVGYICCQLLCWK